MKKRKKITTQDKVDYLLSQLNKYYSSEKTEDDYRKILQSMTNNSNLVDLTLKIWSGVLVK